MSETGKTKALAHEIKINQEPDSEEPADDSLCQALGKDNKAPVASGTEIEATSSPSPVAEYEEGSLTDEQDKKVENWGRRPSVESKGWRLRRKRNEVEVESSGILGKARVRKSVSFDPIDYWRDLD